MQEIHSSNPPVVTGICDPNKSQARHHRRDLYSHFTIIENSLSKGNILIVCFYHFTYVFWVKLHSLISWNRRVIWWFSERNRIRTHNHFVNEHSTISSCWPVCLCDRVLIYKPNGCGFESHCNISFK